MDVIVDKVTVYPPHAICKGDIPVILSAVPQPWSEAIETVRLSADLVNRRIAYYNRFDRLLEIKSRGRTKPNTLEAVLTELAAKGLGIQFRGGHKLQGRDVSRIQRAIAPFMETLLPQLSQRKVWLDK